MKEFTLPASDCGCFIAGEIGPDTFKVNEGDPPWPKNGVIIWYSDKETMKAAFSAAMDAHWPEPQP